MENRNKNLLVGMKNHAGAANSTNRPTADPQGIVRWENNLFRTESGRDDGTADGCE